MNKMQERIATVRKAVNFEKTDRIPTHSNYWTYMMLDAGYTLKEAIYDYDKLIDAIIGFHKKYNFDFYNYTGMRNPFRVTDLIDGNKYYFDESGEYLNHQDYHVMEENEYPELIENPTKFLWEKAVARKCPGLNYEDAKERFVKSVAEYEEYTTKLSSINKRLIEEYFVSKVDLFVIPYDTMFNYLRGLKGMSIDMRRRPK